jgi:hypothetical protein
MMNAREARRLTEEAIEKEIATRKDRAEVFCKGLEEEIEEACNNRKSAITVSNIPDGLYSYVIGICKDNGYTVTQLNNKTLQLNW